MSVAFQFDLQGCGIGKEGDSFLEKRGAGCDEIRVIGAMDHDGSFQRRRRRRGVDLIASTVR
jgi:hypothetical protein